jgi:hypothetical protein
MNKRRPSPLSLLRRRPRLLDLMKKSQRANNVYGVYCKPSQRYEILRGMILHSSGSVIIYADTSAT